MSTILSPLHRKGENMTFEIEILKFIQQFASPLLDKIMIGITILGEETLYIFILTLLYWCVNKPFARRLLLGLSFSVFINTFLKDIIGAARPIGTEGIRSLRIETATGSAFPSGHTQNFASIMMMLMHEISSKIFYIIGTVLIVLMGVSRLYLGVHWPKDVIGAIVIAFILTRVMIRINDGIHEEGNYLPLFILFGICGVSLIWLRDISHIKAVAVFMGFIVGYGLEENFVNFDVRGTLDQQFIKYIIGFVGIIGIVFGLKFVLPYTAVFVFLRYFILMIWTLFGAPLIFVGLRLSRHRLF